MNNLRFVCLLMTILFVTIATPLGAGHANPAVGDETFPQYSSVTTVPTEATGDPYEPNDGFGTATEISNPAFLLFDFLTIDPSGDLDYFQFQGRAGDEVNFYLVESSPLEAVLTLYDANLRPLAEDNDAAGNNDGVATFVHELPENGYYYLRVKDNRHPSAGGEDYTYSLSVHLNETGEPNDDFTQATPMAYGDLMRAYLFLRLGPDVDTYTFTGQQGDFVYSHLWADDWSEELDLCLFGPDQTELVCDNFLMNYELPTEGSYYLQVTGLYPGNYSLYLWLADPVDVYEPNDDRLQATPIELDTTLDAALEEHDGVEFWEDTDYYQVSGLVGQSILAVADSAVFGSHVYPDLAIQDAGGNVLHFAAASTTRTELAFTLPSTGIYYVHVSAVCGEGGIGCQGGYQLQVRKTNEAPLIIYLPVTVYSPNLERDALVALYHSTNGDSWKRNDNWLDESIPHCDWFGVECDEEGQVKNLILAFNQLKGSIPPELGNLSSLTYLDLGANQLSGSIPPELGKLANLGDLRLYTNQLGGSIPPELGNLSKLFFLELYGNQLSGPIPLEMVDLNNLEWLRLHKNQLSGSIPPELGSLSDLTVLDLAFNQLSGSIPLELGSLSSLTVLSLGWNQLSGSIPPELGSLNRLTTLGLAINQLSGSIPPELGNLSSLTYLDLGWNQLSGSIPTELGKLAELGDLRLYANNLSGSIPSELGKLTKLFFIELYGNQLSGPIPHELSYLSDVDWLRLHENQLTCWGTQVVLDWALNVRDNGERASWDYPNPGEDTCKDLGT